jgi:hypothetical protein
MGFLTLVEKLGTRHSAKPVEGSPVPRNNTKLQVRCPVFLIGPVAKGLGLGNAHILPYVETKVAFVDLGE